MIKTAFELRTIGNLLKDRRKDRGLSIEDVARITKIRAKYLQALENGDYSSFPSEVYLKGFLKNYAKFLDVNQKRALAMYRREREYQQKEPTIDNSNKATKALVNLDLTPGKVILGLIVSAIILTVIYIGTNINSILKEPELSISAPIELNNGEEGVFETTEDSIRIIGNIEVGSELTINGQQFETNNFEQFIKDFNLDDGLNTFTLVAESQFGKVSEISLKIIKEGNLTVTDEDITTTITPTQVTSAMNILVEIVDREAYVEVKIDGETTTANVLPVGEILELSALSKLEITTPRPDAVKIIINETDQTVEGSLTNTWELINGQVVKQ